MRGVARGIRADRKESWSSGDICSVSRRWRMWRSGPWHLLHACMDRNKEDLWWLIKNKCFFFEKKYPKLDPVRSCSSSSVVIVVVFALLFLIFNAIYSGYASNTMIHEAIGFNGSHVPSNSVPCSRLKVRFPPWNSLWFRWCYGAAQFSQSATRFLPLSSSSLMAALFFMECWQAGGNERRAFSLWHFHFK